MISSFTFNNNQSSVNIGELNPLVGIEDPFPALEKLWNKDSYLTSLFWVWNSTLVLYCYDTRLPNLEFISMDSDLGLYHGQVVVARIKIQKTQTHNVLISDYTILGQLDSVEAFFCPNNNLQFLSGLVISKSKTDNIVIVEIENEKGIFKVFINALNPKFVNSDHVLNQDSIMVNDQISMIVSQQLIGNNLQLVILNEYSILITKPASKRIKKCRIRSVKINSLAYKLTTSPKYHPTILSKILETGSLEEVNRFYISVDQKIAIDTYINQIPELHRPIFNTGMESEYFEYISCTKHLEVHHPLTLSKLALTNVFCSLSSTNLSTDEEVISLIKIHNLLKVQLDAKAYWSMIKKVTNSNLINLRHREDLFGFNYVTCLFNSIFELPHCECINIYLLELLKTYSVYGPKLKIENYSSLVIESIFRYFYQNHSKTEVKQFINSNSENFCELSSTIQLHHHQPEMLEPFVRLSCSISNA